MAVDHQMVCANCGRIETIYGSNQNPEITKAIQIMYDQAQYTDQNPDLKTKYQIAHQKTEKEIKLRSDITKVYIRRMKERQQKIQEIWTPYYQAILKHHNHQKKKHTSK